MSEEDLTQLEKATRIALTPEKYRTEVFHYVNTHGDSLNRIVYMSFAALVLPSPSEVVDAIAGHIVEEAGVWGHAIDRVCANLLSLQPSLSPEVLARKAVSTLSIASLLMLPADLILFGNDPDMDDFDKSM